MRLPSLHRGPVSGIYNRFEGLNQERAVSVNRPNLRVVPHFGAQTAPDVLELGHWPIRWDAALSNHSLHWERFSRVLRHVQASQRVYGNLSHRHYGTMVVLNNGVESTGTNVEASRQTVFCDLRYAITQGMNQSIANAVRRGAQQQERTPVITTIYLVNANLSGDRPVPCSDCQEWLNSRFCTPDTRVISLEKDPHGDGAVVRSRTVAEVLPLHKGRSPVRTVTEQPLSALPLMVSQSAKQAMSRWMRPLSWNELVALLKKAQQAYVHNHAGAEDSGHRTGVSVLLSPSGTMINGGHFDWSTRWNEAADLRTVANAFERLESVQRWIRPMATASWMPGFIKRRLSLWLEKPIIQAIAYYGDDPSLPPLASLGRIARRRGTSDTLVVMVEDDSLQVRTIADFMPEMYRTR